MRTLAHGWPYYCGERDGNGAEEASMRTKMLVAGAAAGAVMAASLLAAEPPARSGRRGGRGPMDGVARYLGLSDEQKTQVEERRRQERTTAEPIFAKLRANHEKMRAALEAASPDAATVGALAIEGHRLREQLKARREAGEQEIRALLTPEQQTKLDALQALRGGPGGMGPMGPMGRGGMRPRPFGPPSGDGDMPGPGDEPPPQ
jgi:Spy/CpxP family protein refolding chaperone